MLESTEINSFRVKRVEFGKKTIFSRAALAINANQLKMILLESINALKDVGIYLANPGDNLRITNVLDIVEPRIFRDGNDVFPGFLTPPVIHSYPSINRLQGVTVMTSAKVDAEPSPPKQGIVDMSGVGKKYSPFSQKQNIVLELFFNPDLSEAEINHAIHFSGIKAASYLAKTTLDKETDNIKSYDLTPCENSLPKIMAIIQLGSGQQFQDNFVYGRSINGIFPTYMHPFEFFHGAVVGGNYTYGCQRNYTYIYQNNHLLKYLCQGHNETHNFLGTIIMRGHNQTNEAKEMSADFAAKIAKNMAADGVVIAAEGGGNGHVDIMLTCEHCEKLGIKSVILINEIAGPEGDDFSLVYFVKEADAIISVGNREELIKVKEMETIGGRLEPAGGNILIPVRDYCGSTNETGQWNLGALDY